MDLSKATCHDSSRYHPTWDCSKAIGTAPFTPIGFTTDMHPGMVKISLEDGKRALVSRIVISQKIDMNMNASVAMDSASV